MASGYSIFWKCKILSLYVMLIISEDDLEQLLRYLRGEISITKDRYWLAVICLVSVRHLR